MPEKIVGEVKISAVTLNIAQKIKNVSDFKEEIEASLTKRITDVLEIILGGGIFLDVSDIHIESREEDAKLRIRIDGILEDVLLFDKKVYENLISRIKLLSGIKLNITDRPQDGRFSVLMDEIAVAEASPREMNEVQRTPPHSASPSSVIEVRSSILPAEYGESIVLRLLNPKTLIEIEALGLRKDLLEVFNQEIKKPNGMIIVTGPTGSGKTTTLYAFLEKIQNPEIKVITIEDPIEYHLAGISQTQIDPRAGYDFANGLKSIMRQDPDVILVGEIRDLETASIALQAALTGHLVLTTLHTNNAAGTIARLQALGEKPVNIAPAINIIIAQRLVRKVCKKCAEFEKTPHQFLEKLKKELKNLPPQVKIPEIGEELKIPKIKGCKDCNFTGYRERIGIFEAFLVDDEMENFILTSPSISSLRKKVIEKGMVTMKQDGLIKVLEGITTIEEVERVTGE